MWLIFLLYFLYAIIFVIGKFALQVAEPIFLTGVRMVCAGMLSYGLHCTLYPKGKQLSHVKRYEWLILFLLALFNVYITNGGEFWSLQYLSASKTSFIYNLSPFFVLLFSAMLFSEKITSTKLIGIAIGFFSLIPMIIGTESIDITYHFGDVSIAELVMLCSAAATALGWVLMRYFIHKKTFTPYFLNGVSLTIGGMMCLLHAYAFESRPFIMGSTQDFWWYMLIMMFIQNIIAYNLHAFLLHQYSATWISLFSFVMPLMTLLISHLFLSEPITWIFLVCSVGVGLGLLIFYKEELRSKLC